MRYNASIEITGSPSSRCTVLDISDTGARISTDEADALPERFTLMLSNRGPTTRQCQVIWRKEKQVGVIFEGRPAFEA